MDDLSTRPRLAQVVGNPVLQQAPAISVVGPQKPTLSAANSDGTSQKMMATI